MIEYDDHMIRLPNLDDPAGRHFTFRDFCEAGETFARLRPRNIPVQLATYTAIEKLCQDVLDPLSDTFGRLSIVYGFSGPNLCRHIKKHIDTSRDQHAGYELSRKGKPICDRLGQSADFLRPGVSSKIIADWIVRNSEFDRLYFYGSDRPVHVSAGPQKARAIVLMFRGKSGRLIPRKIDGDHFLALDM